MLYASRSELLIEPGRSKERYSLYGGNPCHMRLPQRAYYLRLEQILPDNLPTYGVP